MPRKSARRVSEQRAVLVETARRLYQEKRAEHDCSEWANDGWCDVCDRLLYRVGDLVRVDRAFNEHPSGAIAIVVEVYDRTSRGGDRTGVFLLFASGFADGFSPEDLEIFEVHALNRNVPELASYKFRSIVRLDEDVRRGLFAAVWECED